MKTKHTQGEWNIHGELDELTVESVQNKGTDEECYKRVALVRCYDAHTPNYEEAEANAKLIAAVPALLEGLQMIVDKRKGIGWDAECCALLAEALILKATSGIANPS